MRAKNQAPLSMFGKAERTFLFRPAVRSGYLKSFPECSNVHFPFEKEGRDYCGSFDGLMGFREFFDTCDEREISVDLLRADEISRSEFE